MRGAMRQKSSSCLLSQPCRHCCSALERLEARIVFGSATNPADLFPHQRLVGDELQVTCAINGSDISIGFLSDSPSTLEVHWTDFTADYHGARDQIQSINIIGGTGNDKISLDPVIPWPITFRGNGGNDSIAGGAGDDLLEGGDGNDTFLGGGGNDRIVGRGGDDILSGGDGDDTLIGGEGNNALDGGAGTNSILASAAIDTTTKQLRIAGTSIADEILLRPDPSDVYKLILTLGGIRHRYSLFDIQSGFWIDAGDGDDKVVLDTVNLNSTVFGGSGNDAIRGSRAADRIVGGDGNDWIDAGGGSDTVYGGAGNDRIFGGAGRDRISAGAGFDVIRSGDSLDRITATIGVDDLRSNKGDIITNIIE